MTEDTSKSKKKTAISLNKLPSVPLKSQQTTRTTFNLRKNAHEALSWMCTNYSMKQREFIDDVVVPTAESILTNPEWRDALEHQVKGDSSKGNERKTYVLSKKSLNTLNDLSSQARLERDSLVAIAIALQKMKLDDMHKKHRKALGILEKLKAHIYDIEGELETFLDEGDPIPNRVGVVGVILDNLLMAIEAELDRGTPIDIDDFTQQG